MKLRIKKSAEFAIKMNVVIEVIKKLHKKFNDCMNMRHINSVRLFLCIKVFIKFNRFMKHYGPDPYERKLKLYIQDIFKF